MKRLTPALACALALLPACGSATPNLAEPDVDRLAPTTLYPMLEGSQWVYDVHTGGDEPPTLGIFEVVETSGDRTRIANNRGMNAQGVVSHGEPIDYQILPDGIRHVASGAWLLHAPITADAEWEGLGGRTARVTDIDATVEVVAGDYEHCVEITETGGEDGRTVVTTYCPLVGPVLIESRMDMRLTTSRVSTRATLRSYDSGGDSSADDDAL
jgi:hypothetical protein